MHLVSAEQVLAEQVLMDQLNAGGHQRVFPVGSAARQDPELVELLATTKTESGRTLLSLLDEKPMLLVFLRHFGSPTCRETMADVARARPSLDQRGVRPVFVHLGTPERARHFFERRGLGDVERVSDPAAQIYQAPVFHLLKTTVVPEFFAGSQLIEVAKRALWRYGFGSAGKEDATQMPGVFFLKDRRITKAFRHKGMADRPDYVRFGV
jgi:peroxiredoxin